MAYNSLPFSDSDYYSTYWISDSIDITGLNPDADPLLEYSLNWTEDRVTNGEYAEVRVDVVDSSTSTNIINDIKKNGDGNDSTFTLGTATSVKFKFKIYTHKSFVINLKILDFVFDNKLHIITNDGSKILMDVMAYDQPNYTPVNTFKLGIDQDSYLPGFTASDFESQDLGSTGVIYDNPDIVWEDIYDAIPYSHDLTTSAIDITNKKIYTFGDTSTNYNKLAVMNITTGAWTSLTDSSISVGYKVITSEYYNGNIYYVASDGSTNTKWYKYDITGNSHSLLQTSTDNFRDEGSSVIYDDVVYFMGGVLGLNGIVTYNIGTDTLSTSTSCSLTSGSKLGGRCTISDDKIYFFGGNNTSTMFIYDITGDSWSTGTDMPSFKGYFGCVTTYNRWQEQSDIIYVIGGESTTHTVMNVVEAYNVETDTWEVKNDTAFNNSRFSCVSDNFYVYNIGGIGTSLSTKVWRYEPEPVSMITGAYAYDSVTYDDTTYEDYHDGRIVLGTARFGDTSTTALYTDYYDMSVSKLNTDVLSIYGWAANAGGSTVSIGSIGFFNQDATRQLFSYSKLSFDYDPTYQYKIIGTIGIESESDNGTTIMNDASVGFVDRTFNGQYVSDYTYISKFLAGENVGEFLITDDTMDSEYYGPVPFKTVTIDTGNNTFQGTGQMDTTSGNGNTYNAFAMLCEEPGTKTSVDTTAGFTNPTDPFNSVGTATLTYVATTLAGDLGMTYALAVDVNSLMMDFDIASGSTVGKVELITYNGTVWAVNQVLLDVIDSAVSFKHKIIMNEEIYGIGLRFTDIDGTITVGSVKHAGELRQMAYGTKIVNEIDKTDAYNILVDMVEVVE